MPEALVWGASGGIGSALVRTLHMRGWRVFAVARDETKVPSVAQQVYTFDAGAPSTFRETALLLAEDVAGGLDLVVYAAGAMTPVMLTEVTPADWKAIFDVNLTGAVFAVQHSLNLLNEGSHIVIVGAYANRVLLPRFGPYAAAKAALQTYADVLAKEHRELLVTLVRPPAVATAFWEGVPIHRPTSALQPEVVAEAIVGHVNAGKSGYLDL